MPIKGYDNHRENFQLINQWEVSFFKSSLTSTPINFPTTGTPLTFLAKNINIPFWKFESETASSGAKFYKTVSRDLDFSIDFLETENFTVKNFLDRWKEQVFDTRTMNFQVKFPMLNIFIQMNGANERNTKKFQLQSCIIKDVEEYALTYEEGEPLITKANFSCYESI